MHQPFLGWQPEESAVPIDLPIGYMQVTLHHTNPSAEGEEVVTMGIDVRTVEDPVQDVLQAIGVAWITNVVEEMHSSMLYIGATAQYQEDTGLRSLEATASAGGAGSGTQLPPQVALLVQKRTGFAGKKNRGRMFVPGLPAEHLDGTDKGLVTAFALSVWQPALSAFLTGIQAESAFMVILHQEPNTDPPRLVTSLVVADRIATQRGRMRD